MKKIARISAFAAILLSLVSCNDWLEAVSSTQIEADKLFESKEGYYDALVGVYMNMATQAAYGQYMTSYYPDLIVCPYEKSSQQSIANWQNHLYSVASIEKTISAMWLKLYNTIAGINLELQELDEHEDIFSNKTEYNLIKGELLGLRAYIHFDIMRLWGVAHWSDANMDKKTIPYVTQYTKEITAQKSYKETIEMLYKDVEDALELLADDPILGKMSEDFENSANAEGFWNNRSKHMNYLAAKALKARILMWQDRKEEAATLAEEVLNQAFAVGAVSWYDYQKYVNETYPESVDWTMSTEHLFSLEVSEMSSYSSLFTVQLNTGGLWLQMDFIEKTLFPTVDSETGSLAGREDVRGPLLILSRTTSGYCNFKLYATGTQTAEFRNRMPMLKVSELYLMMAENCLEKKDTLGAFTQLNTIRKHRGVEDELAAPKDITEEIAKEYYREFINEGQMLYYFKRTDVKNNPGGEYFKVNPQDLILPYPTDETSYGRNQEL